jgi:hypothetical protein
MNDQIIIALEICLEALDTGATFEGCLALFPNMENDLRPVLEGALAARRLAGEAVPSAAIQRSRTRMLSCATQLRSDDQKNSAKRWVVGAVQQIGRSLSAPASRLIAALVLALVVVLTSSGLLAVSAKSLPGDTLYPVKRVFEDLRVRLVTGPETQRSIEEDYSQQRVVEVKDLIDLGRSQKVSFEGVLESMSSSQWIVAGMLIRITADTTLEYQSVQDHPILVGDLVEVEGTTCPNGWIEAKEIHLREYQYSGTLEEIAPSRWIVARVPFDIQPETQLDPGLQVGDSVVVLVHSDDTGALIALAIVRSGRALPMSEFTGTPTSTAPITNTPFPTAIDTPAPTETMIWDSEEVEIRGSVMAMNSTYWIVNGQIVYITSSTEIEEAITIGTMVQVNAFTEANGSLTAREITQDEDGYENGGGGGDDGSDAGNVGEDDDSGSGGGEEEDPTETDEPENPEGNAISTPIP